MTEFNRGEILDWVEATDIVDTLSAAPQHEAQLAQEAVGRDRWLLVDTAIRLTYDARLRQKAAELEKELEEVTGEIGDLGVSVDNQTTKGTRVRQVELDQGPIPPFSLLTTGVNHRARAYGQPAYVEFKQRLLSQLDKTREGAPNTQLLGRVAGLLSGIDGEGNLPSDSFDVYPGKGVTFWNQRLTERDLDSILGVGHEVASVVVRLAEVITTTEDLKNKQDDTVVPITRPRAS